MTKLSEGQYRQKIQKIHSELKQRWVETNRKVSFCLEHKFEIEASVLQKENAARYDAILTLEIEFGL